MGENPSLESVRGAMLLIMWDAKRQGMRLPAQSFALLALSSLAGHYCCTKHAVEGYNEAMDSLFVEGLFVTDKGMIKLTESGEKAARELDAEIHGLKPNQKHVN